MTLAEEFVPQCAPGRRRGLPSALHTRQPPLDQHRTGRALARRTRRAPRAGTRGARRLRPGRRAGPASPRRLRRAERRHAARCRRATRSRWRCAPSSSTTVSGSPAWRNTSTAPRSCPCCGCCAVSASRSHPREVGRLQLAEVVAQLVGRADEHHLTVTQHDDAVGDVERVGRVLLDEDARRRPGRPRPVPPAAAVGPPAARDRATVRRRAAAGATTPARGRA